MLKLSILVMACLLAYISPATIPPPQFIPIGPDTILPQPPKPVNIPSFGPSQRPVNIPPFRPTQRPNFPAFRPNPFQPFLDMVFPDSDNSVHPADHIPNHPINFPGPVIHPNNPADHIPNHPINFPGPVIHPNNPADHIPNHPINFPGPVIRPDHPDFFPAVNYPLPVKVPGPGLYCFSCNENYAACRNPSYDLVGLENQYIKCNGQCMKFRNPDDNYLWYRGCSNERFDSKIQPPVLFDKGTVYFFCNQNGCNIY